MKIEFERVFVRFIVNYLTEKRISHSDFARQLFPDLSEEIAVRQWRRIRDPRGGGKPRKLTLSESERISSILNIEFPSLIWQVDQYNKNLKDPK
ncbi:hypothetical protein [Maridesulfovibrio ferrireducens]|uniref:hypothetical protein n=1 Tax=Maridesulfovibrio ferrireducens TaxID=246191 RepID=UPI001A1946BA|nr:hypothetical protein [Maridesulfovibrio ferrireducens]MBI9109883.1 hypothetical protein [Maridesulfovibrio ferrireducens]